MAVALAARPTAPRRRTQISQKKSGTQRTSGNSQAKVKGLGGLRAQAPSSPSQLAFRKATAKKNVAAKASESGAVRAVRACVRAVAKLPKMVGKGKTKSSAKKRFKITGSGKVMYHKPGKQHLNRKLRPKQQRKKRKYQAIDDVDVHHVQRMMPNYKGLHGGGRR